MRAQTLATLYILFLEFAILPALYFSCSKKHYVWYKMLTTLFLCYIFSAIFFLADFKLRETLIKTMGFELVCFSFIAFFRGPTHSYMCSKTFISFQGEGLHIKNSNSLHLFGCFNINFAVLYRYQLIKFCRTAVTA